MFAAFKQFLKWRLWAPLRVNHFPSFYSSHSELGEDMMIRGILHHMGGTWDYKGFFIDIGAHHPVSTSNSWHFYRRGWRGINVDATPGSMVAFRKLRPRDVNLEYCITPTPQGPATFYCFDNPVLNTLDDDYAKLLVESGRALLVGTHQVPSVTLSELCTRYVPDNTCIDFLTIDIEGVDEAVLQSFEWDRWRPRLLLFEKHGLNLGQLGQDSLVTFLRSKRYELVGVCRQSLIMADVNAWNSGGTKGE